MAGVAQNVVVSSESVFDAEVSSSDSFSLTLNSADGTSLQDLIDNELALRISNTNLNNAISTSNSTLDDKSVNIIDFDPIPQLKPSCQLLDLDSNQQFILNESQHTSLHLINNNSDNITLEQQPITPLEPIVVIETTEPLVNDPKNVKDGDNNPLDNINENEKHDKDSCNFKNNPLIKERENEIPVINNNNFDLISNDSELIAINKPEMVIETNIIETEHPKETGIGDDVKIVSELTQVTTSTTIKLSDCMSNVVNFNVVNENEVVELDRGDQLISFDSLSCNGKEAKSGEEIQGTVTEKFIENEQEIKIPKFQDALIVENDKDFDTWTTVAEATRDDEPSEKSFIEEKSIVIVEDTEVNSTQEIPSPSENFVQAKPEKLQNGHHHTSEQNGDELDEIKHSRLNNCQQTNLSVSSEDQTDACLIQSHVFADNVEINECELNNEVTETMTSEKKTLKKKKSSEGVDSTTTKIKKTKKTKKSEEKENHISVKSSFSKFDQLQKKTLLHVRSSDSAKAAKTFNQGSTESLSAGVNPSCKSCGKTVFAMEQIKAERAVWHKNCFRCKECNKQLTLDIYSSHEGVLYCKPHFKELFKPKAVLDNNEEEPLRRRKPEMIIRENQPVELPPDVIRASDKPDLGLEELNSLNVKSRFQVFEKGSEENNIDRSPSTVNVKRSPSILSKLAKFQKKGMDVGVTDESLNGIDYEESSSSSEDEDEDGVIRSSKLTERPTSFGKMEDVKRTWESGQAARKEERREERKQEIQSIRSRLFMGKQGKMKEMYEQAVAESEGRGGNGSVRKEVEALKSDKARTVRERFERGEVLPSDSDEEGEKKTKEQEDMSIFEAGISKKSRSLFLEMDANVAKTQTAPLSPVTQTPNHHEPPKRPRDTESPDREIYRDPTIVRSDDVIEDDSLVKRSKTTSKMLSIFRQMEEAKEPVPEGPKPLKRFTPPPDYKEEESGSDEEEESEEEEEEESEEDSGIVRASDKIEDEFLKQAQNAARAKSLKEKFEHWEPEKQSKNNAINLLETDQASLDSTKSLRARFESLKSEQPKEKARPKVHRFVIEPSNDDSICAACDKKAYLLERVETNGKVFHKACFRCTQCGCVLRMETYTLNNGQLYCLPHFKQLFIAKGNYDEGFGIDQHKRKWEGVAVNGTH